MPKENLLFQLDTKEFQYHKLNHTLRYFNPRFHTTKLIKNANKNSKNQVKNNKKLKGIDLEGLYEEINELKKEILFKKLYRICFKINTKINNNASHNDELKITLKQLALNQLNKTLNKKFKKHDNEYKNDFSEMDENAQENPFKQCQTWISEGDVIASLEKNFNVVKLNDLNKIGKETNKIISKIYQDKSLKLAMSEFEDGMDVFLNMNRGMKKVERKNQQAMNYADKNVAEYDSEFGRKDSDHHYKDDQQDEESGVNIDEQDYSGDDEIYNESNAYREKLPELEHGFIDEYDSDSEDEREMERELKKEKPQKKNRKGQRERRLIWEKKYGKTANHIQKKIVEETTSKLERQQKYEERVAKRLEREQEYLDRLHNRKQREKEFESKEFHPSWEAKRIQEDKLKKVKFTGKKISFD